MVAITSVIFCIPSSSDTNISLGERTFMSIYGISLAAVTRSYIFALPPLENRPDSKLMKSLLFVPHSISIAYSRAPKLITRVITQKRSRPKDGSKVQQSLLVAPQTPQRMTVPHPLIKHPSPARIRHCQRDRYFHRQATSYRNRPTTCSSCCRYSAPFTERRWCLPTARCLLQTDAAPESARPDCRRHGKQCGNA